jgi:protein SCO1/2
MQFLYACKQPGLKVPYYADASFTPIWQLSTAQRDTLHRIGDFSFTDQHHQVITREELAGKVCLSNFFFTSCSGICPRMNKLLQQVAEHFEDNKGVVLLSHSVTPEQDSVPQLQAYAIRNHISSPQWHLLTGDAGAIYHMARKEYYAEEQAGLYEDSTSFLHTEHMVLIDGQGYIRGLYNGTQPADIPRIIADIEALLVE